ncbi:hypothetical protein FRB90_008094 [Tulasnella sp. 427]|nr:hypothetical protein FRB90_008094 [Tulasnella sp. 427]
MATKHTTGSSTASLPPILAPPPRLSAPPSRSVTPLPPSPATTSGFAVPAIPPPNPPPLITPSIISRRAANGSSPLTTSGPSFAPSKPSSTFDDFGDFLDSGGSNSNTNSTAAPTPSDPFFSLGSPLAPTPTTANKPALSPIVTRPSPVSASANGFGSFSMGDGNDGFGDFMSPVQAQPTPPATQFATLAPIPTNVVTLGMPSPRITAPDTPLYPPDPNKPLPPPRSMSPLLKKVANTQSDKWPKPDQAPVRGKVVLPPALAPPPGGGSGFRKPAAQDLLAMGSPVPESDAKQGTGSVFAMMQAQAPSPVVGGGGAVGSSFVLPPPPGSRQFTPPVPPPKIGLPTFTSPPPVRPASVTNGASAKGGLSAADLSFFEGL